MADTPEPHPGFASIEDQPLELTEDQIISQPTPAMNPIKPHPLMDYGAPFDDRRTQPGETGLPSPENAAASPQMQAAITRHKPRLEFYIDNRGGHRFRIVGGNGEIVHASEGYASRYNAKRAVGTLFRIVNETCAVIEPD